MSSAQLQERPLGRRAARRVGLTKVPQVTAAFWITKVLTTGMGEAASDYLGHTLDQVVAVGIGALLFAAALVAQFSVKRYIAGCTGPPSSW
ncbi:hypothetical protein ACFQZC_11130 [Streptacidiphilus monticola]